MFKTKQILISFLTIFLVVTPVQATHTNTLIKNSLVAVDTVSVQQVANGVCLNKCFFVSLRHLANKSTKTEFFNRVSFSSSILLDKQKNRLATADKVGSNILLDQLQTQNLNNQLYLQKQIKAKTLEIQTELLKLISAKDIDFKQIQSNSSGFLTTTAKDKGQQKEKIIAAQIQAENLIINGKPLKNACSK